MSTPVHFEIDKVHDALFDAIDENNIEKVHELLNDGESDIFPTGLHVVAAIEHDNRVAFDALVKDGRAVAIGLEDIKERIKRDFNKVRNGRYAVTPEVILYEDDSPLRYHPSYFAPIVKEMIRPGISMVLADAIKNGIVILLFLGHYDAVKETMALFKQEAINRIIDDIKTYHIRIIIQNETEYKLSVVEINALQEKIESKLEGFRTSN